MTLVTGIYERQPDDALGGRGRPLDFYFESMSRLAGLGAPWVINTDPSHVDRVTDFAGTLGVPVAVVPRALAHVPRFADIQAVRERLGVRFLPIRDRCHALCFGKIAWTAAAAAAPWFGSGHVVWVDAGLAHEGLFPPRLREPGGAFTPAVVKAWQASPLTLAGLPLRAPALNDVEVAAMIAATGLPAPPSTHVVGGVFGGARRAVLELALEFDRLHAALLDRGLLGTEENVLSLFAALHPGHAVETFDTWHHADSPHSRPAAGEVSFHRLFEDWARRPVT
ncbi:MAG: hypothetical protein AB7H88_19980 [Vicinamibacterales bacterium]